MELRVLQPAADEPLYRTAWAWRLAYPRLVRQWDGLKHFRQWFALMKRRVSVGVFTERLIAVVTLRPDGGGVYEVHIDCERGINTDDLITALLNIEPVIFNQWGACQIFGGIISRNRGILRIAEACGYRQDGVEHTIGRLKWVRVSKTNVHYQDRQGHIPDNQHVWESTRSLVA